MSLLVQEESREFVLTLCKVHRYDAGGDLKFKQDFAGTRQHWQAVSLAALDSESKLMNLGMVSYSPSGLA